MDNPFPAPIPAGLLPAFDRIRPEHAPAAIDAVLADNRARLGLLLESARGAEPLTWERLVEPLDDMSERLARVWGPLSHLFAVTGTADWRAAYNACLPKVTAYQLDVSQNAALHRTYERLSASAAYAALTGARQKVIRDALRDFELAGVGLSDAPRSRFREIALTLSRLQSKFQENVLDSAQAWSKHVSDEAQLAGMTEQGKALAGARAQAKGLDGFRLTLDFPSYDSVLRHADDRKLRAEVYEAYATRASDRGPLAGRFDNGPLVAEILALRSEQARLLGLKDYAEMSLATKMASSPDEVEQFLLDLNRRARPAAQAELEEVVTFARRLGGPEDFGPWDLPYYSEKLKAQKLGFSGDDLRPYFAAPSVIRGMFELVERLYGVAVGRVEGIATWHPDVTTYAVRGAGGDTVGLFYLDAYAREDKRSGAWMDECLGRRRSGAAAQIPVAYLTCNFAPPVDGQPALLSHEDVLTLFHEFGHGLHHILTQVDEAAVSGIRGVPWDAVELPSQFMENWCYERTTLRGLARHWRSGAEPPAALVDKLERSRTFQAALTMVRQIEFSLFDLRIHRGEQGPRSGNRTAGVGEDGADRVLRILAEVRREVSVLPPPDWTRMPSSFSHVFAGGYAAGYYSYKWAEVLSADVFAAFVESGFSPETGHRFRDTVLAQGGSREMMDLFVEFRGRRPSLDPLLRQSGLLEPEAL